MFLQFLRILPCLQPQDETKEDAKRIRRIVGLSGPEGESGWPLGGLTGSAAMASGDRMTQRVTPLGPRFFGAPQMTACLSDIYSGARMSEDISATSRLESEGGSVELASADRVVACVVNPTGGAWAALVASGSVW